MARPNPSYTSTMAKIYAGQGYLRKAAQIYRLILEEDSSRADCRVALEALEQQIAGQKAPSRKELGLLMREWIELLESRHDRKTFK